MRIHSLDPAVRTKIFVHLPSELQVDLPTQSDVDAFGDSNDDGYYSCEHVDGYMRESRCAPGNEAVDFTDLDDGVCQQDRIEDTGEVRRAKLSASMV